MQQIETQNRQISYPKKCPERNTMHTAESVRDEMRSLCVRLASPSRPGEKLKSVIGRIAKAGGVSVREAQKYWYGQRKLIPGHVLDNFRAAVEKHEQETKQRYYALLNASPDAEFYRAAIAGDLGPPRIDD